MNSNLLYAAALVALTVAVHAAGLAAVLASRLGGPPALVHAHDAVPAGRLGQATSRVLRGAGSATRLDVSGPRRRRDSRPR